MLSFNIKPGTSAEELSERRKLAYALMQEGGSGAPIGHWSQGANRLAQALIGGYDLYNTEEAARREKAEASSLLGEALGLGGPQTSSAAPQRPVEAQRPSGYGLTAQPSQAAAANLSSAANTAGVAAKPVAAWNPQGLQANQASTLGLQPGERAQLTTFVAPGGAKFTVAQQVAPQFQGFLNELAAAGYKINPQASGGYNDRNIRGSSRKSQHAFGSAIDLNWDANPRGATKHDLPSNVGEIAAKYGLKWGGNFSNPDPMHFEVSRLINGEQGAPPPAAPAPTATPAATSAPAASTSPLGVDPNTARIIQRLSMNDRTAPLAMKLLEAAITPKGGKQRYTASKQGILDTWTGQIAPIPGGAAGDAAEYGTTPQYYRRKDGTIGIGQMSKAGGMRAAELPTDGAEWMPPTFTIDTGTEQQIRTRAGAVPVENVRKDIVGKEAAEEVGKLAGQARAGLPAAKTGLENARLTINALRNHPGIDAATGLSNWTDPRSWTAGTDAFDFLQKNQQATGQSFMAAREALKGAGQVTDFEGAKGEQAIANLNAAQSKKQYLEALDTLERMMEASYRDLETKANAGGPAPVVAQPDRDAIRQQRKQKYGLED